MITEQHSNPPNPAVSPNSLSQKYTNTVEWFTYQYAANFNFVWGGVDIYCSWLSSQLGWVSQGQPMSASTCCVSASLLAARGTAQGTAQGGVIVCCVSASLLAARGTAQGTAQGGCHCVLCFSLSTGCQRDCPRGVSSCVVFQPLYWLPEGLPKGVSSCVVFQPLYWLPEGLPKGLPKGGVIVCCVSACLLAARGTAQGGCHCVLCFSLSTGCQRDCPRGVSSCVVFQPLYWLPEGLPKGGVIVCCVSPSLLAARGTAQGTAQGGCHRVLCFSLSTGCQRDCPRGCHRVLCFSLSTGCQRECPRGCHRVLCFSLSTGCQRDCPRGCHRVLCFSLFTGCQRDCPRDCPRGLSSCVVF